jgi:hypothetical protein
LRIRAPTPTVFCPNFRPTSILALSGLRFVPKSPPLDIRTFAELALHHLAEDPQALLRFMDEAGYSPDALRRAQGSAALARGLLDHVVGNEPLLLSISANARVRPEDVMRLWSRLNRQD